MKHDRNQEILFFVFGLAMLAAGGIAFHSWRQGPGGQDMCLITGGISLASLVIMLYIRHTTKCPHCKKVWVGKKIGDEDLGVPSNAYTKKVGDNYRTFERPKHLLSYKCTSCGNEWQKTVEEERQLD